MGIFDRQIATAKRLIDKYGQVVTWNVLTNAAPIDSAQPWRPTTPATPTTYAPKIAFFSFNSATPHVRNAAMAFSKDTEIIEGRLYGLMAAQSFVPTMKDSVIRDSVLLSLSMVDPIRINDQTIVYILGFEQ